MTIQRIIDWFKPSSNSSDSLPEATTFYRSIYPESVRYALQYREAQLGKAEMIALLPDWHFEVVYLLTKALGYDREYQRNYLEDLTRLYYRDDWTPAELRMLLRRYLDDLPADMTVTGTKLAQLSRSGAGTWQNEWRDLIASIARDDPDALPCFIAHTPIYAYHHVVDIYRHHPQEHIVLLIPDWLIDRDEPQMGYRITLAETPTVHLQVKKDCLYGGWTCDGKDCQLKQHFCRDAIFIDDTINTARTAGKLQSFWLTKYGLNMPLDRVYVITNLREDDENSS